MKRLPFSLFVFTGILLLGFYTSCSKEREVNDANDLSVTKTKDGEMHWNTDARMATIYALQYAHTIVSPKFTLNLTSEQLPIFISGKEAAEHIDWKRVPYSEKEKQFILEQLYRPGSRAIVMKNIPHWDGKQKGDIVYIPYEESLLVPEEFTNRYGAFLDNFQMECEWQFVEMGAWGGSSCFCHIFYSCNYASGFCHHCPEDWGDFQNILETLHLHPDLITKPIEAFEKELNIEKVPLGKSIFHL